VFAASSLGMTINTLMTADIEEEVGVVDQFRWRTATAPFPSFRSTAEVGSLDGFHPAPTMEHPEADAEAGPITACGSSRSRLTSVAR
jgi:hypothetical protein